ncbi:MULTISPECIES: dehydrogenase [unclassified Rothia (in: high G+C Gram-positive bacteria)]|uniref:dehydrogenase n=1 Tax=unclassified Rothia (in: high G+C Gram-positive bacteria) TaxID=2689056 RepID=UPI001957706C|nr:MULTISPECIES: dehydrogenase [unclassified Rothia (in: high G+C Gram-positive bacteria)]MBM7051559.1 dehydrogenase [Rothia sp. ZJ1223]QRZ61849.1 dehydrogenase [Rothia sp. ZJ932]
MGFKGYLQKRRDDADLGQGLWRRNHDRFVRGLDRFHQILERMPSEQMIDLMVPEANALADLLPRVRAVAEQAHRLAPSDGADIPYSPNGTYSDLNRSLSKAGNSLALCAEALAMMRCSGECSLNCAGKISVARRVTTVEEHVAAAEVLVQAAVLEK